MELIAGVIGIVVIFTGAAGFLGFTYWLTYIYDPKNRPKKLTKDQRKDRIAEIEGQWLDTLSDPTISVNELTRRTTEYKELISSVKKGKNV